MVGMIFRHDFNPEMVNSTERGRPIRRGVLERKTISVSLSGAPSDLQENDRHYKGKKRLEGIVGHYVSQH
jgi:hypothetical protein